MSATTVVVAREFRGSRLYLVSAEAGAFCWSDTPAKALKVSVAVAHRIISEAQAYHADAFAIDASGDLLVPRASGAAKRAAPSPARRACIDCGKPGELTGHQDCQYPGRYSDRQL